MTGPTAHQALYRRWRAQTFGQIVGQQAVVTTLRNAVRLGQLSHALLFVGPRGTGKTSMARIVAKAVNCLDLRDGEPCDRCHACVSIREGRALDLIEIDAASNRGINEIRALREGLPYAPTDLRRKVYILDEAHQITKDAWNALLKSLEEPPEHVTFIFASTEPSGFPAAILSRLQRFDFRPLTVPEIEGKLRTILAADGRAADPDALTLIATLAAGGMRDAESMLDQLLAAGDGRLTADQVRDLLGLADADAIDGFIAALATADTATGVRILDGLEERGRDVRTFIEQLVDAMRLTLLAPRGLSSGAAAPREALLSAARRLAALDLSRSGPGGLRFQLELVLFEARGWSAPGAEAVERGIVTPTPEPAGRGTVAPTAEAAGRATVTPTPEPAGRGTVAPTATAAASGPPHEATASADTGDTRSNHAQVDASLRAEAPAALATPAAAAPSATRATAGPSGGRGHRPQSSAVEESGDGHPERGGGSTRESPSLSEASPDLAELLRRWPEIVLDVGRKPAVKPLIGACRPIGLDGNVVVLGFPENQVFLRDLLERRRAEIEEGISRHLGRAIGVRCVATNLDLAPAIPGDADAGRLLDEFHRIFAGDVADVPDVE